MTRITCFCTDCEYCDPEYHCCEKDDITISDENMTSAGFMPLCLDYVEINYSDYRSDADE